MSTPKKLRVHAACRSAAAALIVSGAAGLFVLPAAGAPAEGVQFRLDIDNGCGYVLDREEGLTRSASSS